MRITIRLFKFENAIEPANDDNLDGYDWQKIHARIKGIHPG